MVPHIHVPKSVPSVYSINPTNGKVVSPILDSAAGGSRRRRRRQWLFSLVSHERQRGKIGGSGGFIRSIFEAWDLNGDGVLSHDERD
mmetsp:Transcript_19529/g.29393  ORF Transcript_19529/g.29393 Transcript_19529/m.29393 type:complete len:87 (+) Transcript_19529:518-778(+)